MGLLLVIGALIIIAMPVATVVLLVGFSRLKARVAWLEAEVRSLRPRPETTAEAQAATVTPELPQAPPPAPETAPIAATEPSEAPAAKPAPIEGPWSAPMPSALPGDDQNRPIVLRPDRVQALFAWLIDKWVYVVSAVSLSLAGIFFVQYGIEKGYLPPLVRVIAALLFGATLISAGEWIRRRYGDAEGPTAFLPSTFSAAGIVSMFAGIVAARQLYGLIGPEAAMLGLVAVGVLAIVLGWFHGAFLAAIGLIGMTATPFVVGGASTNLDWLFGYFALVTLIGLAVDAVRRWAWISVLALVLGFAGGALIHLDSGSTGVFAVMLAALALMSIAVPVLSLRPAHDGWTVAGVRRRRNKGHWPSFPVRLAAGTMAASVAGLLALDAARGQDGLVVLICLAALMLAVTVWAWRAPALADLAALPVAGMLIRLVTEADGYSGLHADFVAQAIDLRPPETSAPATVTLILGLVALMAVAAGLRSLGRRDHPIYWAVLAVSILPIAMLPLEMLWTPARVLGAYPWALHSMALAAVMVVFAVAFARADGKDRRRAAYATLSALTLITFALFAILTKGALTLALAVLALTAAVLDRRFRMPEMTWFILAGVAVLTWRLIADPGVFWAIDAPLWEVLVAYGGAIAAMAAGILVLQAMHRRLARFFLEAGLVTFAGVLADVLIYRWIDAGWPYWPSGPWPATLMALPWLAVALVHLYRLRGDEVLRWVRWGLAAVAGLIGLAGLAEAVFGQSPLVYGTPVAGPPVLDTLALAYAVPGLVLLVAPRWLTHLPRYLGLGLRLAGVVLVTLYAGLEIRRFFQGDVLSNPGTTQGELYAYTMAMMLVGAALLYEAIARRSATLRRIAMGVIALTVAKVFLIDISGLTGLMRVFSFLALGLSLAGLAWLNRWAAERQGTAPGGA